MKADAHWPAILWSARHTHNRHEAINVAESAHRPRPGVHTEQVIPTFLHSTFSPLPSTSYSVPQSVMSKIHLVSFYFRIETKVCVDTWAKFQNKSMIFKSICTNKKERPSLRHMLVNGKKNTMSLKQNMAFCYICHDIRIYYVKISCKARCIR